MRARTGLLLFTCVLIGIVASTGGPRAQAPTAAFYAVGDLPGGGATTIIKDATKSGGVIYAVGAAVTRLTGCGLPSIVPCAGPDTPILWRFDGLNPATLEALPDIDPGVAGILNGGSAITPDGRYIASQARKAVPGGFAQRPVRVDTSLLPSPLANLDLATFLPAPAGPAPVLAISSDGTILYGNGTAAVPLAIRFDTGGATTMSIPLVGADTQNSVAPRGASADGTVVVGASFGAGLAHAYRYVHGSGVTAIPNLPGGTGNNALAVSPDGDLVLVGGNSGANPLVGSEAYLYRASTSAIQPLGSPNTAFRVGGRLCANFCNPTIQVLAGMTADGSVVAMNFTNAAGPPESGYAYFHNANGWFHLASALGANGVDIAAAGWQHLLITGMSSDGTLVFGAGEHNGVVEGFVAEFGPGVLASFKPTPVPPTDTSIVSAWGCSDPSVSPTCVLVFTADGAYYHIESNPADPVSGFEHGYYTFDGSHISFTTLLDTNGSIGISDGNGSSFPVAVIGDSLTSAGEPVGYRIAGSIAEPLVGGWISGDPTLPGGSFVAVLFGVDHGYRMFQASDGLFGVGFDHGTYRWDAGDQMFFFTPSGGVEDMGSLITPSADRRSFHVIDTGGLGEFDAARVIDPATIPVITSASSAAATTALPFAYQVTAIPAAASFSATGLPNGLTIDADTGVIDGAPTEVGDFNITLFAWNAVVAGTASFELTVIAPVIVAPGPAVVTPIEPEPGESPPVTIEFTNVTSGGTISVATIDPATVLSAPDPPAGFSLGDDPVYYEITPGGGLTFNGPVTVCFSYAGVTFAGFPRLLHYDVALASWVDITTSVNTATMMICGMTASFSPFAIAASAFEAVGFHRPIEPVAGALNTVKGGSTVVLKFNVYEEGHVEITNPARIHNLAFQVSRIACESGAHEDSIPFQGTGGTELRYDTTAGQFVQNWKTPSATPGACYLVKVTGDGLLLSARFKMK